MTTISANKADSPETRKVIVKEFWCPNRGRAVSVTFAVKGRILRKLQAVVDCPAANDPGPTCEKQYLCAAERRWATREVTKSLLAQWPGL